MQFIEMRFTPGTDKLTLQSNVHPSAIRAALEGFLFTYRDEIDTIEVTPPAEYVIRLETDPAEHFMLVKDDTKTGAMRQDMFLRGSKLLDVPPPTKMPEVASTVPPPPVPAAKQKKKTG